MTAMWAPARVLAGRRSASLFRAGLARYLELDLTGSEALFRDALGAAREAGSEPLVAKAGEHLYAVLRRRRRFDEAVPVLEAVVAAHRRRGGPGSDDTSAWRNELIRLLGALGRDPEAEAACRERVEAARHRFGTASRQAGLALVTLGWCLRQQRRWDEARAVYEEALGVLQAALALEDPATGWALAGLAVIDTRLGELEQAEARLRRAHANWDRVGRFEMAAATLEQLMDLYVVAERDAEALALVESRAARAQRLSRQMAEDRERQLRNEERHAFLLQVAGRPGEAARYETRAAILRQELEVNPRSTDGASWGEDPAGPVFDTEPVLDWLAAGPVASRHC